MHDNFNKKTFILDIGKANINEYSGLYYPETIRSSEAFKKC